MEQYLQASLRAQLLDRRERLTSAVTEARESGPLVRLLQQVDGALERMTQGTYGICDGCHDPIEQDRLLADPLLCYCLDHLDEAQRLALQQDLELAARIQGGLLPDRKLVSPPWETFYHYEPAGAVSGDYCDLLRDGNGSGGLFFAVGDVSGKGVAASLLMAHLHASIRSLLELGLPLNELVGRANRIFCTGNHPSSFATLICGRASESGEMEICNAGHCSPFAIPSGAGRRLEPDGLPLGLFANSEYSVQRFHLKPGQGLFLYTDGVTEARNAEDEEFGETRLAAAATKYFGFPGPDLIRRCRGEVADFVGRASMTDDVTLMLLRRT